MTHVILKYKAGDIRAVDYFLSKRLGRKLRKGRSDREVVRHLERAVKLLVAQVVHEEAQKELDKSLAAVSDE